MAINSGPQLLYQVSPIFLTGGIAAQLPSGSVLPLLWLTRRRGDPGYSYITNVVGQPLPADISLDDAFGSFQVLPQGNLVAQQVAKYPFPSQVVAANATIREPLSLSLLMDAPMRGENAWANKLAIMTSLKMTIDRHNNAGGTYTVCTPAYMYTDLLLTGLSDASRATSATNALPQNAWKFDFERPLVTMAELTWSLNQLAQKLTNAVPTSPVVTGVQVGSPVGQSPIGMPPLTPAGVGGMLTSSGLGIPTSLPSLAPGGAISVVGNIS